MHKMNFWDEMELQKWIFHGKIPKNAGKTEEKSCKTAGMPIDPCKLCVGADDSARPQQNLFSYEFSTNS